MKFECPICGFYGDARRKDTYHFCPDCTVVFLDPSKFTGMNTTDETLENTENDEIEEIELDSKDEFTF